MKKGFRKARDVSVWRRIAVNAWAPPREATIHGSIEIDATNALAYISATRQRTGSRVTITHLVAKAVANAIGEMPHMNAIVSGGRLKLRESVDIFLQVALDEGESLSGATIREADKKTVDQIANELNEKVVSIRAHEDGSTETTTKTMSKVPDRMLGPVMRFLSWLQYDRGVNLSGLGVEWDTFGSAMVTNVGMFGLQQGYAPVFPLGRTSLVVLVGEVAPKPVVSAEGEVIARPMLGLHATIDHRVIDGYHAGVIAQKVRSYLVDPGAHE